VRCFCHRSAKTVDPGVWCGQTDDLIVWNLWRIRIARTSIKSFWNYEWSATDKGSASNGPTTYYSAGRPCKPLQVVTVFTGWPFPCSVLVTWSEKKAARKPWAPDDNTVMSMLAMVPVDRSVHLSLLDRQCVRGSNPILHLGEQWKLALNTKGVFGTALLPFFQLRSSSTVPNTCSSTNSAPRKTWSWRPTPRFSWSTSRGTPPTPHFLWSSTCSMNSTVELPHGGVRGAELEKQEQSSPKHALIQCTGFASFFLWRWALYVEMTLSERNLERTNRPERASVSVSKRVALSH
jgi:hypothetical protein